MTDRPASRRSVLRRVRTMAALEAVNVGLLAAVFFWSLQVPASVANLAGYGMLAVLLLQGSGYWSAKYRQLRSGARCPSGLAAFRTCRVLNLVLLTATAVVVLLAAWRSPGLRTWPGLGFWVFAVAEYVNYFQVQLSYQTRTDIRRLRRTRRLRRSHLAADLRRCGRAG